MRAPRWGEELLQAIQRDAEVAQDLKNEASLLALTCLAGQALYTRRHFRCRGAALDAANPGIRGGLMAWLDRGAP